MMMMDKGSKDMPSKADMVKMHETMKPSKMPSMDTTKADGKRESRSR